jgi:hypothetical protein
MRETEPREQRDRAYDYCLESSIYSRDDAKHTQGNVCGLLFPRARTSLVVQHGRVDIAQRHAANGAQVSRGSALRLPLQDLPSKTPDERDELVKIFRADPAESRAAHDDHKSEYILLPLDVPVHLPASGEESVLHNPHGGEELQRHRK